MALSCRVIGSGSVAHGLCFLEETVLCEHADPPRCVACDDEMFVVDPRIGVRPIVAEHA